MQDGATERSKERAEGRGESRSRTAPRAPVSRILARPGLSIGSGHFSPRDLLDRRIILLLVRTALPAVLTVSFVVIALYLVAIPTLADSLLEARRASIRQLTDTVWHLLMAYNARVEAGELTLAEAQSRAAARIRDLRYGSDDRGYFWINDMQPIMLMHPFRSDLEGQDLSLVEQPDGTQLFTTFRDEVVKNGEGFFEYHWQRTDDPGPSVHKLSFIRAFHPWGWMLGTGVFVDDVEATVDEVTVRLNEVFGAIVLVVLVLSGHATIRGLRSEAARRDEQRQRMESEEMFRALAESSTDVIMRFDQAGRHLYANPAVEQQSGIPPRKMIGKTHEELGFPPDLVALWQGAIAEVVSKGCEQRIEFQLPSGIWIDWLLCPEFGPAGEVQAVITSARDISVRKASEEQRMVLESRLASAAKMEAVGRLAGGVAHDFNNILTVISGFADALAGEIPEGDPRRRAVEEIQGSATRATRLVNQLLTFSGRQHIEPAVLDLGRNVRESRSMLTRIIGEDVDLQVQVDDDVWPVRADRGQVDQILVNLVVNARDAMPRGGRITLKVRNFRVVDAVPCRHCAAAPKGDYVLLEVSDTGEGISESVLERVFEPFFTTKGMQRGTGLGLAVVLGAVQQSDAHVDVSSEPGRGSTFSVYFPRVDGIPEKRVQAMPPEKILRGAETILLVEDEELVCELATRILHDFGYAVLAARSGEEALEIAREHDGEIDLLVSDVVMPAMDGFELWRKLRTLHHDLPVLFLSGYPQEVIARRGVNEGDLSLLRKPFTKKDLAEKVRDALDRDRPPHSTDS